MLISFNTLSPIVVPLMNAVYAYDCSAIKSHQLTYLQQELLRQELRAVENAWYWGLGDVLGSLKLLVLSIGRQGWDEKNPAFMSVQRAWGNAVHFLKMDGEVDGAMTMPSTTLPEWLCVSLFRKTGIYTVQAKGSNISPRQMQDVKLNPARKQEVTSQVVAHNPDAEWISIEDSQDEDCLYEDGLCLEIWFYDGHIGAVYYDDSLAKSREERSELLQLLVSHA